jgi:ribonuclease HII
MYPNLREEKKLWAQGYKFVVGLDEAGRGPLAGPVTAAAVMVRQFKISNLKFKIKDSKKLNGLQREEIYKLIIKHPNIKWGVGIVSEKIIDKINILEATKIAMRKAIKDLSYKSHDRKNYNMIDFLLIDGNFALNNVNVPQKFIIGADEKVFSCVAAGIIAKVTRDRIMQKLHKKYPQYGFSFHKGYGTKMHIKNLQNFGPCKIHRKSFYPVRELA